MVDIESKVRVPTNFWLIPFCSLHAKTLKKNESSMNPVSSNYGLNSKAEWDLLP